MCAVCGCLTTGKPAPQDGKYMCIEAKERGKEYTVELKKGETVPECPDVKEPHWKLAT